MKQLSHLAVRPASVLLKRLICAYALIILGPFAQSAPAQVTFSGDFASPSGLSGCGLSPFLPLSPGQSCTVAVTFTPQSSGPQTGLLQVGIYAAPSLQTLDQLITNLTAQYPPNPSGILRDEHHLKRLLSGYIHYLDPHI